MSQNEKFAWVAAAMVTGFSLVISLAPGLWVAVAGAVLLMACFTAISRLERFAGGLHRGHWYYLLPLIAAPSVCGFLAGPLVFWVGPLVAVAGGAATYYLARGFTDFKERSAAVSLVETGER